MFCDKIFYLFLLVIKSHVTCEIDIQKIFLEERIVPDVIAGPPRELLTVEYEHGDLNPGDVLDNIQVENPPMIDFNYENNTFYTLLMLGVTKWNQTRHLRRPFVMLTEPSSSTVRPPKYRISPNWLLFNIPENRVEEGKEAYPYVPAIHINEQTIHERFVFLLYKQPEGTYNYFTIHPRFRDDVTNKPTEAQGSRYFMHVTEYLNKYIFNYTDPVAGNFFDLAVASKEATLFPPDEMEIIESMEARNRKLKKMGFRIHTPPIPDYPPDSEMINVHRGYNPDF